MTSFITKNWLIFSILLIGLFFRLLITSDNNILFHMDSARDFIDVREMVLVHKIRLIGPTSAIDGVYTGPAWYYLLSIPFIISVGDPYAGVLMEILLWFIGGFFLLKLVSKYSTLSQISVGLLWNFAPYIVLLTQYTYNPNPVTLLSPLWVYLLLRLEKNISFRNSFLLFLLTGFFFNFEMNNSILLPIVIFVFLFITNHNFIKSKFFWIGTTGFIICLLPQIFFDLKHNFLMTSSLLRFINQSNSSYDLFFKARILFDKFQDQIIATMFNNLILVVFLKISVLLLILKSFFNTKIFNDPLAKIALVLMLVFFVGYLILPVNVNSWHLGFIVISAILLISLITFYLRPLGLLLTILIIYLSSLALLNFFQNDFHKESLDPSLLRNELRAIDYVYQNSSGKNFRVYTHIPSVYDYPYQYLFYWYGLKKYGFLPREYTYLPNKPEYIPSQSYFQNKSIKEESDKIYLIKELQNPKLLDLWMNNFSDLKLVKKAMVGPIEIETRSH